MKNDFTKTNPSTTKCVLASLKFEAKGHDARMPAGCAACGGNYPQCKASCPLFDD